LGVEQTFDMKPKFFPNSLTGISGGAERLTIQGMERKIFWASFTVLGLLADFVLPIWWALAATIPIVFVSWWVAYRSGWFD